MITTTSSCRTLKLLFLIISSFFLTPIVIYVLIAFSVTSAMFFFNKMLKFVNERFVSFKIRKK